MCLVFSEGVFANESFPSFLALAGACTQTEGYLSYDEILSVLDGDNVTVTLDETAAVKIAVWDTDQWIGYDDPETILLKLEYANSRCIGGAMVWAVDTDLSGTLSGKSNPHPLRVLFKHEQFSNRVDKQRRFQISPTSLWDPVIPQERYS